MRIWDVGTGLCVSWVEAHAGQPVCSVMWAPDVAQPVGASLLTGGELNTQVSGTRPHPNPNPNPDPESEG